MLKSRKIIFFTTIGLAHCVFATISMSYATGANVEILSIVAKISSDRDAAHRTYLAEQLADITQSTRVKSEISRDSLDAMAGLLSDRDDDVRGWAAVALSFSGPDARRALPKLEDEFSRIDAVQSGVVTSNELSSESTICVAIFKIGGSSRLPRKCRVFFPKEFGATYAQKRSATVFVPDDQVPKFVGALKAFANAQTLDASTNVFEKDDRELADVKIKIGANSYFQINNFDQTGKIEMVAFSSDDEDYAWSSTWQQLIGTVSSKFGNSNVVVH